MFLWITPAGGDANPAEPVAITGGTCTDGNLAGGTITFVAAFSHIAGYAIGSDSLGLQEAYQFCNSQRPTKTACNLRLPAMQHIKVLAPVYSDSQNIVLDGSGSVLENDYFAPSLNFGDVWTGTYVSNAVRMTVKDLAITAGVAKWTANPSAPSTITVTNTATLTIPTCPTGFYAALPSQYLWLNGTTSALEGTYSGTGELVKVTGGNCTPGAVNGTIIIAPAEPGNTNFYAHDSGYSLSGPASPFFEDNGQGTIFQNITTAPTNNSGVLGRIFQNDNDQAQIIDNFSVVSNYVLRSDVEFVGSYVFAPGPFSPSGSLGTGLAGVTNVKHSFLNLQCAGNAIEWYSGNTFTMTGGLIQAWAQFGAKFSQGRGGFGKTVRMDNVYSELGSCTNPLSGVLGGPDVIINGMLLTRTGPNVSQEQTAVFGSNGGNWNNYYVVPHTSVGGDHTSVPIPIGYALVTNPSVNNTSIKFLTSSGLGTPVTSYDILAVTNNTTAAPNGPSGTSTIAVATGLVPNTPSGNWSGCDIHGLCTFLDTIAPGSRSSYTVNLVPGGATAMFYPVISHIGSGGIVLTPSGNTTSDASTAPYGYAGIQGCVLTMSAGMQNVIFNEIGNNGGGSPCISTGRSIYAVGAVPGAGQGLTQAVMLPNTPDNGNSFTSTTPQTGKLNFGHNRDNTPGDFITLIDSNQAATEATALASNGVVSLRRTEVASDAGICHDGTNANGSDICQHANDAVSTYIGAIPTSGGPCGTNCVETVTASLKTFKVPIAQQSVTFATLPGSPVNGESVYCSDCTVTTPGSCTNVTTAAACTCAASGTGAEARRINGAWLCN